MCRAPLFTRPIRHNWMPWRCGQLTPEQIAIVSQLPQVARTAEGRPLVAPQFLANTRLTRADGEHAMLMLRVVTADVWTLFAPGKVHTTGRIRAGARQVLASRTLSNLLLGVLSALASAALVWVLLDGASFGASTYDQAVYAVLVVDSGVVMTVLMYSLILGLVSTLRPLRRLLQGTLVSALQN